MNSTNSVLEGTPEVQSTQSPRRGEVYRPNVDILETADELTLLADMPGTKSEHIDLHFEDGALTIHAKVDPRGVPAPKLLLNEYGVGDFYRTFRVSDAVDPARMSAEYRDGVLTLHLPKLEAAKPRKIAVTSS